MKSNICDLVTSETSQFIRTSCVIVIQLQSYLMLLPPGSLRTDPSPPVDHPPDVMLPTIYSHHCNRVQVTLHKTNLDLFTSRFSVQDYNLSPLQEHSVLVCR